MGMEAREIGERIKGIIGDVANLDPAEIDDKASFIEDLELDSLSLLEIGVDIDYQFKLGVSDERLKELRSVEDAIELVQQVLSSKQTTSGGG
jgi:acyl carrier protein